MKGFIIVGAIIGGLAGISSGNLLTGIIGGAICGAGARQWLFKTFWM